MNADQVREFCQKQGFTALQTSSINTPRVDENYNFRRELLIELVGFFHTGMPAMKLVGHKGTGKTTVVEQFHAALNYPLLKVTAHPRMEVSSLIGQFVPVPGGGFAFRNGPLTQAALSGASLMIDEYNLLDAGEAAGLNNILERGMFVIPETGDVIKPVDGFRVFASCNHNARELGFFGRNDQDSSNDDRFWTIEVGYPSPEEETPLVQRILETTFEADIAKSYAKSMVDVANRVRNQFMGVSKDSAALELTMSTRNLLSWAIGMTVFHEVNDPVHFTLARALTNQKPLSDTKVAIHQIATDVFGS